MIYGIESNGTYSVKPSHYADEYSDVALVVDGQRFRAHRVILAARSDYFRALLYGGMKESQLSEIELKDTSLAAFKHLLRYIYTGQARTIEHSDHTKI